MCRRYRCVVGVNADQWYISGADASTPIGGTVVDGELFRTPEPNPNPFISMGQLQIDVNGVADARPGAGRVDARRWRPPTASSSRRSPSTASRSTGEITLYTHRLGRRTPDDPGVSEWIVEVGPVGRGRDVRFGSSAGRRRGGSDLRPGQGAIAARGATAVDLAGAILYEGIAGVWVDMDGAYHATGGFPVLFENGEYTIFPDDPGNQQRAARTVAGWTAAGELLLVTADERPGWSAGPVGDRGGPAAAHARRGRGDQPRRRRLDDLRRGRVRHEPALRRHRRRRSERSTVDALVVVPPEGIDFARRRARGRRRPPARRGRCRRRRSTTSTPPPPTSAAIACAAWRGITSGTGAADLLAAGRGQPGPDGHVPRADAARRRRRRARRRARPRSPTTRRRSTRPPSTGWPPWAIVLGVGGGRYDPQAPVTRNQMATFLARAVSVATGGAIAPPAQHDYFADDPLDLHQPNINIVAELGIAGGVGGTSFNPGGRVSRAQMATFLVRALDVLVA